MEGGPFLWFLSLLRVVIVAAAVVLLVFLTQPLFVADKDAQMRASGVFYTVQDLIEQHWSVLEASVTAWLPNFHELQQRWALHFPSSFAAGGLTLLFSWALYKTLINPYIVYRFLKKQGLKGVAFRPFIGQFPEMRQYMQRKKTDPAFAAQLFPLAPEKEAKYGCVYFGQMGTSVDVVVTDPAAAKEVLITKANFFEKPASAREILKVLGNGLVFSEGSVWERQRRMINPAFTHSKIKAMADIMSRCANEAAERWCKKLGDGPRELDMHQEFVTLALDVIGRSAFGSGDALSEKVSDGLSTCLSTLLEEKISLAMSGKEFIPGYKWLPTQENRRIARREKQLRSMGMQLIRRRRAERERGEEKQDLLGLMLAAQDEQGDKKGMADAQLLDECMTFLLAGHETTAILLTWTVYLLTKHSEYCECARKEILEVLAGRSELPFDDLHKLKLLHCILLESLRLIPPVPFIGRVTVKDVEVAGFKIPRGVEVSVISYPMHTRESLWGPDAKTFRPERFADGVAAATKLPMAFLPFSAGPRNCVGQNFATTEAKLVLVKILRTFSLKLAPGYKHHPVSFITIKPKDGLPIIVERLEEVS